MRSVQSTGFYFQICDGVVAVISVVVKAPAGTKHRSQATVTCVLYLPFKRIIISLQECGT